MLEFLKVSIIVPVHNAEGTLDRCIDSIISQSYKNIECILIENGSEDNSYVLCTKYAEKYKNVIVKTTNLKGVSNARNEGLLLATGDIVGFCDADDFLEFNAIKSIVNEFLNNKDLVSVFGAFNLGTIDSNGNVVKKYVELKEQYITVSKAMQLTIIDDSVMGSVWNKYYKFDFLKNKKFSDELSFCEDMHFNSIVLDSIEKNKMVKLISTPIYCYMDNSFSATHNLDLLFDINDNLKYIIAFKKIDNDCDLDCKSESYLRMKIACFAIDYLDRNGIDLNKQKKLLIELKNNYFYLIRNIFTNNLKWNIKRVIKGIIFLKGGL